ncbi:MAG: ATP synthase F1 subunit epsilon [Paludibacteraceae bacterium]|jgi:F-type H+-transporting ATPase subunit epsilon|nr:ATP synthase F1 subunit epsilon [Paludibacteraceae bacterium]MBR5469984.1 ATP synthase F1 subunit epsilon [Paludibacteraceae bacterium]
MRLEIISPEGLVFEGEVSSISVPGMYSAFTILKNHAPIISSLSEGKVVYVLMDGKENELFVNGGFVEVGNNVVTICIEKSIEQ